MNARISTLLFLLAREFEDACKTSSPCCSSDAATKADLATMEQRLLTAIGTGTGGISAADDALLGAAIGRLKTIAEKFEQMDAQR